MQDALGHGDAGGQEAGGRKRAFGKCGDRAEKGSQKHSLHREDKDAGPPAPDHRRQEQEEGQDPDGDRARDGPVCRRRDNLPRARKKMRREGQRKENRKGQNHHPQGHRTVVTSQRLAR